MTMDGNFFANQERIIKENQERYNTDSNDIDQAILSLANSPVVKKDRINKGRAHEVYSVQTESGKELILRISQDKLVDGLNKFEVEKWCLEKCSEAGIPVPEVLALNTLETSEKKKEICLESKLPGESLDVLLPAISDDQRKQIFSQAGKILSKIHSIPVSGFGLLDKDGKGEFSSIQEMLGDQYISPEKMNAIAEKVSLDKNIVSKAYDALENATSDYSSDFQPKLLHNDYEPKHILVHEGNISGILDFELARGGDPVMDLARWHFFFKDKYSTEELLQKNNPESGYSNKEIFKDNFDRKFNLWRIYLGLMHLAYCSDINDQVGIDFSKKELADDVYWYANHFDPTEYHEQNQ